MSAAGRRRVGIAARDGRGAERARRRAMGAAGRQRVGIAARAGAPSGRLSQEWNERGGEQ
jgi:hypothetical protein